MILLQLIYESLVYMILNSGGNNRGDKNLPLLDLHLGSTLPSLTASLTLGSATLDDSETPNMLPVLLHVLSSPVWDAIKNICPEDNQDGIPSCVVSFTLILYRAVAIVEFWKASSFSQNDNFAWSCSIEKLWLQLRVNFMTLVSGSWYSASDVEILSQTVTQLREVVKACAANSVPFIPRDWELIQSELMLDLPEDMWGVRTCCNPSCNRLEGPCEIEVKTMACGGGCGARYCCKVCQEQAWRAGHRRNCKQMKEMMMKASLLERRDNDAQGGSR